MDQNKDSVSASGSNVSHRNRFRQMLSEVPAVSLSLHFILHLHYVTVKCVILFVKQVHAQGLKLDKPNTSVL